ncbi:MAG: type I 3-dehydroquinate dehydratase [Euryarchaeota archaeon]|nr:type I 3-dehydroquinate dehydratase [Euryarchaeota archaeon]
MALPKVCIVLDGNTVQDVLKQAEQATAEGGEIVEVRFDKLYVEPVKVTVQKDGVDETSTEYVARPLDSVDVSTTISQLKKGIDKPVLFTCRSKSEGGDFPDDEKARIAILKEAILSGVSWIDLEIEMDAKSRKKLFSAARKSGTTIVASHHSLDSTPSSDEIVKFVESNKDAGDIIKLCYTCRNYDDALSIFEASWELKNGEHSYALMGQGIGGDWARLHAPKLSQNIVFTTLRRGFTLADKGLINVRDLNIAWEMLGHAGN